MNQQTALKYMRKQMRKIGKTRKHYDWEPVSVVGTVKEAGNGFFQINAYNEIYILINPENYYGLFILSDESAFNSEDVSQNGAPEFSGVIQFIKIASKWNLEILDGGGKPTKPIAVEFIRVIIY